MNQSEFDAIVPATPIPADGIVPRTPDPEYRSLRLDTDSGDFALYGETAQSRSNQIPAIVGRVIGIGVARHGQAGSRGGNSWQGERPYLVLYLAVNPLLTYALRLPTGRGQWHYRSLLGSLLSLQSFDRPLKLQGKTGDKGACFVQVFHYATDTGLEDLVREPSIGPTDAELHLAVNTIRERLGHPVQFVSADTNDTAHQLTPAHDSRFV